MNENIIIYDQIPEGYWQVNGKKFHKKFDALKHASENQSEVKFIFFDHLWNNFDRTLLGKSSLKDLYKLRAQQLRDEYDYLILYFSGGADSYNVLRSFIDNKIKLDEVCVKWPMSAVNAKVYTPNTVDMTARNTLSEWDFAIKPVLEWLGQNHREIKISVVDWTKEFSEDLYTEELFKQVNNFTDVEIPFMISYSDSEKLYLDRGKKVASIYGVEKPKIAYQNNKWFMGFMDTATTMGTPSIINPLGTEYFYWSSKFPLLAFEQAYQVCCYLDKNPHLKKYFFNDASNHWEISEKIIAKRQQNDIVKEILYDNWSGNFQSFKPDIPDRADKHFWIFEHPELEKIRDHYIDMNCLLLSQLDSIFNLEVLPEQNRFKKKRGIYKTIYSKWHYVKPEENVY